ncbi:MAG: leucine-rich repeat domain-containing protein, partial [Deltaproteobacteria bacterium]|nr:leucine-rich repeat domain-containing protein [Deltaproteobacteria bacterium]
ELPEALTKLTNLTNLYLSGNKLTDLPETLTKLTNLTILYLSGNKLTDLPETLTKLTNLTILYLSFNKLTELPEAITKLTNLTNLYLSGNQLTDLPETLTKLTNLTNLGLSFNKITKLPEAITKLTNLTDLDLSGNPIKSPPPAVVKQGIDAIRIYFKQIKAQGEDNLYHLKILLVGEPDAGKTSLMKRLIEPEYKVPSDDNKREESTVGIDIKEWNFKHKDTDLKVNLWDFGGQQIQYMIHHFFLTPESLYLLISDKRSETDTFDYWFNIISLLGKRDDKKKAAVLVVENEIDMKSTTRVFDYNAYNKRYGEKLDMQEPANVNLSNKADKDKRFEALTEKIKELIFDNKIKVPANWVNVKKELDKKTNVNYIDIDKFYKICKKFGAATDADCKVLLRTFNNLGILNHYESASLDSQIFLNPKWITDAVYFILKESIIEDNEGRFTKDMLFDFLGDKYKETEKNNLLNLMSKEHFEICYSIDNNSYIAPQFLPDNKPDTFNDWSYDNNLRFQMKYSFMPEGIISRLIVRLNKYIEKKDGVQLVWKKGVVLNYKKKAKAYICENIYRGSKFIDIRIDGDAPIKKECLHIIRAELNEIHKKSFTGIDCFEEVACNCSDCKEAEQPRFFESKDLGECILKCTEGKRKNDMVSCIKSGESMSARDLLDGIKYKTKEKEMEGNTTIHGDVHGDIIIGNDGAINKNNPNLENILKILPSLIKELQKNAKPEDPENNENIKIMEEAQEAAEKGDEPKTRKLLSKVGNWIANVGKNIGQKALTDVITKFIG